MENTRDEITRRWRRTPTSGTSDSFTPFLMKCLYLYFSRGRNEPGQRAQDGGNIWEDSCSDFLRCFLVLFSISKYTRGPGSSWNCANGRFRTWFIFFISSPRSVDVIGRTHVMSDYTAYMSFRGGILACFVYNA